MKISRDQEEKIRKTLERIKNAQETKFKMLLVGRTGVGKSSTINSFIGQTVAREANYEAGTLKVENYEKEIKGFKFSFFDTPGLCDDLPEAGNDYKYVNMIKEKVNSPHLIWFVTPLNETRVTGDEKRAIKIVSQAFGGDDLWKRAIIVFTFGNNVPKEQFNEAFYMRTKLIRKEIAKYTKNDTVDKVKACVVDNKNKYLLNGTEWLAELFVTSIEQIPDDAKASVLYTVSHNVEKLTSKQKERLENNLPEDMVKSFDILGSILKGSVAGAAIGTIASPGLGTATGWVVGGTAGLLKGIFNLFR